MTFELRCVRPKCGKRVSPDSAYRRRQNKGLCICGGALKVTSAHYYGTNPVDEAAPDLIPDDQGMLASHDGAMLTDTPLPAPDADGVTQFPITVPGLL